MKTVLLNNDRSLSERLYKFKVRLFSSLRFHRFIRKVPIIKYLINYEGGRIYDVMAGFIYSQILHSLVELDVLQYLKSNGRSLAELSSFTKMDEDRTLVLLRGACALKLIYYKNNSYWLSRMGVQILGIPGLLEMIGHNQLLYKDLESPVSILKGKKDTHLRNFWPYVKKTEENSRSNEDNSAQYSKLMQTSQRLVAEEALDAFSLAGFKNILDLGGGTGAFLYEVNRRYPNIDRSLFDLPDVINEAEKNKLRSKHFANIRLIAGSFLDDDLPKGFDLISLVRVLYDHRDDTVERILSCVYKALPHDGKVLITEPMSGGISPSKSSDCYFSFYTMAMTTGKVRSFYEHKAILEKVGFSRVKKHRGSASFITQVITAEK